MRFVDYDRDSYKTGPGVYKSSFKNAMRLARTEINMAYRAAEQERWKQFDFVVGYEVKVTQNGKHVEDICDCLQGKYNKDFVFRGWHPQCMCYAIPILKTEDEFWELDDTPSENEVTDVPQGFKDWVIDNEERIERAAERGTLPYFLRDNPDEVEKILHPEEEAEIPASTTLSIQERASIRHANRDEEQIRTDWANRKINMLWDYVNEGYLQKECVDRINELKDDIVFGDFEEFNRKAKPLLSQGYRHSTRTQAEVERIEKAWRQKLIRDITLEAARYEPDNVLMDAYIGSMRKARINSDKDMFIGDYENAKRLLAELRRQYTSELKISDAQLKMFGEFEKYHGIKRGKSMTAREADIQSANPDFIPDSATSINCQTCAPAYVLRSQGFDIIATPRIPGSVNDWIAKSHSFDIWENADGSKAKPTLYREWLDSHGYKNMTSELYRKFYEEATTEPGIYITTIGWASGGGHATIIQRFADSTLAYIEPQVYEDSRGIKRSLLELCNDGDKYISKYSQRGIMRVDDKVLKHYCKDSFTGITYDIWSIFGIK